MSKTLEDLKSFLADAGPVAKVEVARARGSTPREEGAWMLVSREAIHGTIGGGQLEFMAIDKARQALSSPGRSDTLYLDIPLGPEIGQCCGGRVEVAIRVVDEGLRAELILAGEAEAESLPHVYIFGGGHVGRALANAIVLLPVRAIVVETRADALENMPAGMVTRLTPVPEEIVRTAPSGSAFMVLTHDHALDFLIVSEALKREDAAYVGMIGSKTKRATFKTWFTRSADGSDRQISRLFSPIGGDMVKDKRPAVIASLAAAEVMTALTTFTVRAPVEIGR